MVKTKSELKKIGTSKPDIEQTSDKSEPGEQVYLDERGGEHSSASAAFEANKRIREKLKSEQTQVSPEELRELL